MNKTNKEKVNVTMNISLGKAMVLGIGFYIGYTLAEVFDRELGKRVCFKDLFGKENA